MRKGIDHVLVNVVRVDRRTGEQKVLGQKWVRPLHGHKVLAKRRAAAKAAKLARKRSRVR